MRSENIYRMQRLLSILFSICLIQIAIAAPRMVRNVGTADGLQDLLVNSIYEDATGLMWFGTGTSVERFDGLTFTRYALPDSDKPSQRIEAITGYKEQIYACSNNTLYCLSSQTNQLHTILSGQIEGLLRDLCVIGEKLYIATSKGLYTYHLTTQILTRHLFNVESAEAPQNELRHIRADEKGYAWLTSKAGLHSLSPEGEWCHYYYSDLPEGGFTELAIADSVILLGSFHDGIYRFDKQIAKFSLVSNMVSPVVSLQMCDSIVMIATDGDGVFLYNSKSQKSTHLSTTSSSTTLTSNSVYRALIDSRGLLWMGFYQHGLDYTVGRTEQFSIHQTSMLNTEGKAIRALAIHNQQRLIGTRDGLYFVDKEKKILRYYDETVLNSKMVFATLYNKGLYYIGTYGGGLYTMDEKGAQPQSVSSDYIGGQIFTIAADSLGRVWVGSDKGVAVVEERKVVKHFDSGSSILPKGYTYCIYFDAQNRGWICTENGMVMYDPETDTLSIQGIPTQLQSQTVVRSIYCDAHNKLYFMPQQGKTIVVDSVMQICNIRLPEATNLFMIEDHLNQLWIGTTDGLYCKKEDNSIHRYGIANGLPSAIFTLCQPQKDDEGTIWLGNSEGLVYLKSDSVIDREWTNPVTITQVEHMENNVTFHFSDLRYTDPNAVAYQYKLDNIDADWQIIRSKGNVAYRNLPPGKYTFHVRLYDQPHTETIASVRVPLSKGHWMAIGILSIILAVTISVYVRARNRTKQSKFQNHEKKQKENKYTHVSIAIPTLNALFEQIEQLMKEDKIYLQADLKIADIAQRLNVPSYQLSYLFTQYMQTTFYDYLYDFRIEEFKRRVAAGDIKRYTVESIAQQSGFNSRASFFRVFKKKVGMTPNEYIRKQ